MCVLWARYVVICEQPEARPLQPISLAASPESLTPISTSIWRAFSPKWVSGLIRPLHTATSVVKIEVPIGTKYFEGVAAPQGGLVGGGSQVLFPKDFKIDT